MFRVVQQPAGRTTGAPWFAGCSLCCGFFRPLVQILQSHPPALGDSKRVCKGFSQALGEEAEFSGRGVLQHVVGVSEKFVAHAELDRLRGIGQPGHRSALVVSDQVTALDFTAGLREQTKIVQHQATSSPRIQYGPVVMS